MKAWLKANAKALTALVAMIVLRVAAQRGWTIDDQTTDTLSALLVSMCVWLMPNSVPAPSDEPFVDDGPEGFGD